jgi:hypothetical protein
MMHLVQSNTEGSNDPGICVNRFEIQTLFLCISNLQCRDDAVVRWLGGSTEHRGFTGRDSVNYVDTYLER